jgi:hypothetical protein
MIENKQQRPTLIATKNSLFFAHKSAKSRATPRLSPQLLHRVDLERPVDIAVDKGTPRASEKAQQNQHFKYHRPVRYSYRAVNKPLTKFPTPEPTPPLRATPIVTLRWNMHRSRATCPLNVTSIGICLSRQHVHIYRNHANFTAEIARTVDSTGMQDYSETDLWNARWPTSQGFFRGLHESA